MTDTTAHEYIEMWPDLTGLPASNSELPRRVDLADFIEARIARELNLAQWKPRAKQIRTMSIPGSVRVPIPAKVSRTCRAHRELVRWYRLVRKAHEEAPTTLTATRLDLVEDMALHLAAIWNDHDDYKRIDL